MKKIIILIMISSSFFGCNRELINSNDIEKVVFFDNKTGKILIEEKRIPRIKEIITKLNSAKKYLAKFKAIYRIEIYRTNSDKTTIYLNGNNLKINGISYSLGKNVLKELKVAM